MMEGDEEGGVRDRWGEVKHKQRADRNEQEWMGERGDRGVMMKEHRVIG